MTREETAERLEMILAEATSHEDAVCYVTSDDADALESAIKALKQEPCEDAISRQAVLDIINFEDEWLYDAKSHNADTKIAFSAIKSKISELLSVTLKPKTGRWIDGKCNRCGTHAPFWAMASAYYCSKYCPNCGAKMAESEEA